MVGGKGNGDYLTNQEHLLGVQQRFSQFEGQVPKGTGILYML